MWSIFLIPLLNWPFSVIYAAVIIIWIKNYLAAFQAESPMSGYLLNPYISTGAMTCKHAWQFGSGFFLVKLARSILLDGALRGGNARWTVSDTPGKCSSPRTFPKGTGGTVETGAREHLRTGSLRVVNNSNKDKHCAM